MAIPDRHLVVIIFHGGFLPSPSKFVPDLRFVIVFFHGGGFVFLPPDFKPYDAICHRLACKIGAVVVFVNYHLAPEYSYPTQYDNDDTNWLGFSLLPHMKMKANNGSATDPHHHRHHLNSGLHHHYHHHTETSPPTPAFMSLPHCYDTPAPGNGGGDGGGGFHSSLSLSLSVTLSLKLDDSLCIMEALSRYFIFFQSFFHQICLFLG